MREKLIEDYFDAADVLGMRILAGEDASGAKRELERLINRYLADSQEDISTLEFFKGELEFYRESYEKALKHYLHATGFPQFHFFCYRASAHLFEGLNRVDKALSFSQKALKIKPKDYLSLALLHKLYRVSENFEEMKGLDKKLREIKEELLEKHAAAGRVESNSQEMAKKAEYYQNIMETSMNTESDIFSSPASGTAQSLAHLYPGNPEFSESDPYTGKPSKADLAAFEELRKQSQMTKLKDQDAKASFMPMEWTGSYGSGAALEERVQTFQRNQSLLTTAYLEQAKAREAQPDFCLYYLNGWLEPALKIHPMAKYRYLTEQSRESSGGMFIRWNGKGIAVNPGRGFLEYFHERGLHIRDIDYVIVTTEQPEGYAEVKEIYELVYQLNKMCPELQIIHYYFHQKAFQELSRFLKPHFKQERNTLHSLELFVDSPDVERIELSPGISLYYFLAASRDNFSGSQDFKEGRAQNQQGNLGIRLDLKPLSSGHPDKSSVRIGYLAKIAWNPLLAHHLGSCDILITAFGNTGTSDYNKLSYNSDCLGYYGTYTLLEEIAPRLLLTGEFGGREGDIRLEAAQRLRQEYLSQANRNIRHIPVILPADTGLFIQLQTIQVKCTVSNVWVDPSQIKAIKTAEAFGRLEYLAPTCCY